MGESSSADQVYDTEFCQTQFLQWDWLLPFSCECWREQSSTTRGSPKPNDAADGPRGESLGVIFWQLYVLFVCNRTKDRTVFERGNWLLLFCVRVTNYARLWVIDDLLINYYRHISTITIFCFFFLLCLNLLFVWRLLWQTMTAAKRETICSASFEKTISRLFWLCVCLFVCVNSISNGHTVGKEGSW